MTAAPAIDVASGKISATIANSRLSRRATNRYRVTHKNQKPTSDGSRMANSLEPKTACDEVSHDVIQRRISVRPRREGFRVLTANRVSRDET